jgi:zinc/manganese transport system substrate-binding protein
MRSYGLVFRTVTALAFVALAAVGVARAGRLSVVASIPDIGVMAGRIGGDRIHLETLASGREDLHGVPARPSFLPKLNRADILLTLGLDAEHAWLPALARESRNRDIMEDHKDWIEVYHGLQVLDVPRVISRAEGEQHPEGNPHYNVSPAAGPVMARNIADALIGADPSNAAFYEERTQSYIRELEESAGRLKDEGRELEGVAIVSYHPDVSYLAQFYGMDVIGSLEPKAGIEPTAGHLAELAERAMAADVRLVIYHQAQSSRLPEQFARKIGAVAVQFANMVGAKKEIRSFTDLQEHNLRVLLDALGASGTGVSGGR